MLLPQLQKHLGTRRFRDRASSQRAYDHAIRDFIDWYCLESRLAFNNTDVTRNRINLEHERYAASTINLRFAVVPRLAYEVADAGLLSPDLPD